MLLELLISMVVLTTGLGGVLVLLVSAVLTNGKSSNDTTSTMLAEHVLEQISGQPANSTDALTITDCAGTGWTVQTVGALVNGGTGGSYGGAVLPCHRAIEYRKGFRLSSFMTRKGRMLRALPNARFSSQVACGKLFINLR